MSSPLNVQSPLATLNLPTRRDVAGDVAVVLTERVGLALATVVARNGAQEMLAERTRTALGLALPSPGLWAAAGPLALVCSGPQQWLAVAENEDGRSLEARLQTALDGLASIFDQTDARSVMRISGTRAPDVLAKLVPIDLHISVFGSNKCASTLAGHIGVQLWRIDDRPTYECAVIRSLAVSFWRTLETAGAEFGIVMTREVAG